MGKTRILNITAFAGLVGLSSIIFPTSTYAETATQQQQRVGASIPTNSVSISVDGDVNLGNVIPSTAGNLAVGRSKVTVTTDAPSGYQLYVSGADYDNITNLTSLNYNDDPQSSSKLSSITATTPTKFTTANQWGVAVGVDGYSNANDYNSAATETTSNGSISNRSTIDNLKWHQVGKSMTKLAQKSKTDQDTYVYYGVYIDHTAMTGNYSNHVIYTAFAEGSNKLNVAPYAVKNGDTMTITAEYASNTLHFNKNQLSVRLLDGETQVGTCGNLNITNDGSTGLLEFTCNVAKNDNSVNNKDYDIALSINLGDDKTLEYSAEDAWKYAFPLNELTYMQEASAESCANTDYYATTNTDITLIDNRTNASYLIRRLNDGNCWMAQNLWLEANKTYIGSKGTSFSTGVSSNSGWNSTDASGTQFYESTHIDNTIDGTSNTGSFFSWKKATADTGGAYGTDKTATDDVCPTNWALPTGDDNNGFKPLYIAAYNNNYDNFNLAWAGFLVGYCNSFECPRNQGINALWWTSAQNTNNYSYNIYMDGSTFDISSNGNKGGGCSVRCMLLSN